MDSPFLVGFVILAVVAAVGYGVERMHHLAKPAAMLATLALIGAAVAQLLR